jgi:hypothetical protein
MTFPPTPLVNLQGPSAGFRECIVDSVRTEAVMLRKDITGFDQPIVFVPGDGEPAALVLKPTKEEVFFFGEFGHLLLRASF